MNIKLLQHNTGQIPGVPKNPRLIKDDKYRKLVKSITDDPEMLELRECLVYPYDGKHIVIAGNMRLTACRELGITEIPVKILPADTPAAKIRAYTIKDNVAYGENDWELLSDEWDADELTEWGVDIPDFEVDTESEVESKDAEPQVNKAKELNEKWQVKRGDLFQIGNHRLLCGDSTLSDDVLRLMGNEKSELLFTSPPYADMREYGGECDLSIEHLIKFIPVFYPHCAYQVINLGIKRKDNEIVEYWQDYINKAKETGYKFLSWNVWDKMNAGSIAQATMMFMLSHEWIFVFGKEFKRLNRTIPNNLEKYADRHGDNWRDGITKGRRETNDIVSQTTSSTYEYHQLHSCLQQTPELSNIRENHPAIFPVGLPSEYIKAMTDENDIICEPFLGSGTTMIAAQNLNRRCFGMELSESYCAVILQRMYDAHGIGGIRI